MRVNLRTGGGHARRRRYDRPVPSRDRRSGVLTTWDDGRGFGFVETGSPARRVFVHVSQYDRRHGRPQIGSRVTFETGRGPDGREQATAVRLDGPVSHGQRAPRRRRWPWALVVLWCGALAAATVVADLPVWVVGAYGAASLVCFVAYWLDKRAAVARRWRTPESTLLLLGLVGGWPGAVVAQETFRHKTVKKSFRTAFWGTVLVHVLVVGAVAVDRWWYPLT